MLSRSARSADVDTLPHTSASPGAVAPHPSIGAGVPASIVRIGTDQVHVVVRPNLEPGEFAAVARRIEQLLEAGYETVDVISNPAPSDPPARRRAGQNPDDAVMRSESAIENYRQ